jgi:hypothetical protein
MQQGLKLQQSGNSVKLLLAEAVHRGTMRFESVSQIGDSNRGAEKEHRLDRIISVKSNSASGGKSRFLLILFINWFELKVFARFKSRARFYNRIRTRKSSHRSQVDRSKHVFVEFNLNSLKSYLSELKIKKSKFLSVRKIAATENRGEANQLRSLLTVCRFAFGRVFGEQNCQPSTKAR